MNYYKKYEQIEKPYSPVRNKTSYLYKKKLSIIKQQSIIYKLTD